MLESTRWLVLSKMLMMMSKTSWITGWEPAGDKRKESKSVSCLPARTRECQLPASKDKLSAGQVEVSMATHRAFNQGQPLGLQSWPTTADSIMANHCRIKEAYGPTVGRTSSWRTNRFKADRGDQLLEDQSFGSALRKPSSCWTVEAEVFTEAEINANIIQSTHNSEATTNPNTNEAVHDESHEAFHDQSTIEVQSQKQKSSSPRRPRTAKKPFDSKC
jgi:hypothetical protein